MYLFGNGYNCCQSVVGAFSEYFKVDRNVLLKMASGFGAGIARRRNICGALTGGIMILGLGYSGGVSENSDSKELSYEKASKLIDSFRKKFGYANCSQLLGLPFDSSLGTTTNVTSGLFRNTCPDFVDFVIDYLAKELKI